jgi:histidine triad (HIT) family protein
MDSCLFCKIIRKEIPAEIVFEDEEIFAFKDISPQAPVHILVIPKLHISTTSEINSKSGALAGRIVETASGLGKKLSPEGYRLVFNCGEIAGQSVFHIHCHLLGGRKFDWPPG